MSALNLRARQHLVGRGESAKAAPSTRAAAALRCSAMATKPVVLHLQSLPLEPRAAEDLHSKFENLFIWEQADPAAFLAEKGASIRGVVTGVRPWVNQELLDKLPNVEIVSSNTVGLDKVDVSLCKERGVSVTNTPDVLTDCTADTALALLLACMRQIPAAHQYVCDGRWPKEGDYPVTNKVCMSQYAQLYRCQRWIDDLRVHNLVSELLLSPSPLNSFLFEYLRLLENFMKLRWPKSHKMID